MKSYKAVVFDFDGTIADSFEFLRRTYNFMAEELHFPVITDEQYAEYRQYELKRIIQLLPLRALPIIILKMKRKYFQELSNIKPFPGIKDCLLQLQAKGIELYIVSNDTYKIVQTYTEYHGLDVFDKIYCRSRFGSKVRTLQKLLKDNGLQADEVLYVGDEVSDIRDARAVKIDVVAVEWGYNHPQTLSTEEPTYQISQAQQLVDYIKAN